MLISQPFLDRFSNAFRHLTRNDPAVLTEKDILNKKRKDPGRPGDVFFLLPPGRQETDIYFSVAKDTLSLVEYLDVKSLSLLNIYVRTFLRLNIGSKCLFNQFIERIMKCA